MGTKRARLDPGRARLLFLVDEDEVDLALSVREEGGGVVLAPYEVQVDRRSRRGGVLRGPRVRRRRVLQDLREREKKEKAFRLFRLFVCSGLFCLMYYGPDCVLCLK